MIDLPANREVKRALAVKMILLDFKTEDICELLNVSAAFVSKWKLNHHQLEAGGLTIGGLNRRLEEKAAGSRWFAPRAERPSGGLKPPTDTQPPPAGSWWVDYRRAKPPTGRESGWKPVVGTTRAERPSG